MRSHRITIITAALALLTAGGAGSAPMHRLVVRARQTPVISLSTPACRVFQVDPDTGTGEIAVTGRVNPSVAVEARWNGGSWTSMTVVGTSFSGTLTGAAGQGVLEARKTASPGDSTSIGDIGIGDIYVLAGQSNCVGQGTTLNSYSHATLKASVFRNAYFWGDLMDPVDDEEDQVDTVSKDLPENTNGSTWPLLATRLMARKGYPVAFVPCAMSGAGLAQPPAPKWLPIPVDREDRMTLYGSMVHRARVVGRASGQRVRAVLYRGMEADASNGQTQAQARASIDAFAAAVAADLGCKTIFAKPQNCIDISDVLEGPIWAAIGEAWAENANTPEGPDLSDLSSDDSFHFTTTLKLTTEADRWDAVIE